MYIKNWNAPAWLGGLWVVAACANQPSEPGACFPVPAGAQVLRLAPGMRLQGTSLQGESDFMSQQGTTLQGEFVSMQGTTLQGEFVNMQGTRLQAAAQPRAYRGLRDLDGAHLAIATDASNAVILRDGQLVARGFADTASLRGTAIAATAPDGREFRLEIVAATLDGATERVEIHVDGQPACQPGMHGVFVAGRWDAQAAYVDDAGLVTYSCMDGVIAKCVDWGYAPWLTDASVHASCTRMARADYCGNGTPWTLDGTGISIVDRLGISTGSAGSDLTFEAAWGPSGALCVAKSRYAIEDGAGRTVVPGCFATLPRCRGLDDTAAQDAVLANRSRVMPIAACR
jgi:hypothetical protein